jgi:hypothetical protein
MRRLCLVICLFIARPCLSQEGWQLEVIPGITAYSGDLAQSALPFRTLGPSAIVNLKYDWGDMIVLRAGLGFGKISGNDKYNDKVSYRNLNFKTDIWEATLMAEVNLLDPETFYAYPYLLAGVGLFHFNPYTYDKNNNKTYLKPLSTEGQGLPEYPKRKEYSLTQFCLPFGFGWKYNVKSKYAIGVEIAVRYTFTDYLDDVSANYISSSTLLNRKGPLAVELAFRQNPIPAEGVQRGNPEVKDFYFMTGFKFTYYLTKKKDPKIY